LETGGVPVDVPVPSNYRDALGKTFYFTLTNQAYLNTKPGVAVYVPKSFVPTKPISVV